MFTYGPYYPPLVITVFRPNGPFTYEMPHMVKGGLNSQLSAYDIGMVWNICSRKEPLTYF